MLSSVIKYLALSVLACASGGQKPPNGHHLLNQAEKLYQGAQSIHLMVEKVVKMELLNKTRISKGEMWITSGGKLRWETQSPNKQLIVINPKTVWLVDYPQSEEEPVAILKARQPKKSQPQALVTFLMGQGKISDSFRIKEFKKGAGEVAGVITLSPKESPSNIKTITLEISKGKPVIRSLKFVDDIGNETSLKFSEAAFDNGFEDKLFEFDPPKNSEITVVD
ncbi:MAG: outer membrane lipoprotein carrier protein LolA [Oligoflexia bacterium]|nr:outer membrane lipoprotein carrier protein LolA [Oligoflexia bacterium]